MKLKINSTINETIVIPVYEKGQKPVFFTTNKNTQLKKDIKEHLKIFNFQGKKNETLFFNIGTQKILLIGINKEYTIEDLRKTYSQIFKILKTKKEDKATLEIPKENKEEIIAIIEGLDLTDYQFDKYLKKEEPEKEIEIDIDIVEQYEKTIKETLTITKNVKFARNLVNENSNVMTPQMLETLALDLAKKHKLKHKTLSEKQIEKEELNLLHAVGQGSNFPPRLIILEYKGNPKSWKKTALVGKGITFDTGGINLKPTGFLEDMRSDMAGAAAVLSIFKTAIELKIPQNLILVIAAAENAIGSKSYKPGDIITSYSKTTVEVLNTDAEGRLVLADAISYVQQNYKPSCIIDLATLTGANLIALGPNLIGMLGNDKEMKKQIFESGEKTSERVWELPIYDEHRETLKSKFADIKNHAGKYGGTIAGAAFIEKFIEKETKWVHLDIAGAARSQKEDSYIPEFATGKGIRLIVEYLKQKN